MSDASINTKGGDDWDTPYKNVPSSKVGEFSSPNVNPTYPGAESKDTGERKTPLGS